MIQIIITLMIILGSFIGLIFFGVHYYHQSRQIRKRDWRKNLKIKKNYKAIKKQDDFIDNFDWLIHKIIRMIPFIIFIIILFLVVNVKFTMFVPEETTNQQTSITINNNDFNQTNQTSIVDIFNYMVPEGGPRWITVFIIGILYWIIWTRLFRISF